MYPDYDGEQDLFRSRVEQGEREMLTMLAEAMRDGEVPTCTIRYEWAICDTCKGHGGHSRRLGVIDHETWSEWDDDERAFYMGGGYDATCDRCRGTGKVQEVNMEALPDEVREWIDGYYDDLYEGEMIRYQERLMGC